MVLETLIWKKIAVPQTNFEVALLSMPAFSEIDKSCLFLTPTNDIDKLIAVSVFDPKCCFFKYQTTQLT